MSHLLKADLYKLRKSTALKAGFLVSLISISLLAIMLYNVSQGNIGADVAGSLSLLTDAMMVSLLSSLVIGMIVCGDFKSKIIHAEITCGGRGTITLTKTLTSLFITAIMLFPYAALAIILFASHTDLAPLAGIPSLFINIMTNGADVAVDASAIGKSVLLCVIGMFVYLARLSICIPVAFIVRRPVAVLAAGIISSFGFDMIVKATEDVPILGDLLAYTPYAVIYDLDMDAGAPVMLKAVIASGLFIGPMVALTYAFFRKAEIK